MKPRKLTPEQVREAREWWAKRKAIPTPKEMMRRLGIGRETLRMVCIGHSYKRVR